MQPYSRRIFFPFSIKINRPEQPFINAIETCRVKDLLSSPPLKISNTITQIIDCVKLMRAYYHCRAKCFSMTNNSLEVIISSHVESYCRFIKKHHLRPTKKCPANAHCILCPLDKCLTFLSESAITVYPKTGRYREEHRSRRVFWQMQIFSDFLLL